MKLVIIFPILIFMLMLFFPNYSFAQNEPTQGFSFSNPGAYDALGNKITTVNVDQQIHISADVMNHLQVSRNFVYVVQIEDSGQPVNLGWSPGYLSSGQSLNPTLSWVPPTSGAFVANLYVFDSIPNLKLLAPPLALEVSPSFPIQEVTTIFDSPTSSQSN